MGSDSSTIIIFHLFVRAVSPPAAEGVPFCFICCCWTTAAAAAAAAAVPGCLQQALLYTRTTARAA